MDLLAGVRVVSVNHFLSGPAAAQILADLGADVIAVEPPGGAFHRNWAVADRFVDGQSVNFLSTGRNKRSLAVDMKTPEGVALVRRLLSGADVFMENFRPGTLDKMGLGWEQVRHEYSRLVYASATGFGGSGPYRDRPGQDLLLQAMSGLAARTGRADGPPVAVGSVIVDQHAATVFAMAILAALHKAARTGQGTRVEVSLFQAALDLQVESITAYLNGASDGGSPRAPAGIASWFSAGPYGIHPTADGHMALSMSPPKLLGEAMDIPELVGLSDKDGFTRREEVTRRVAERLAERTTAEWLPILARHGVWHAPVRDYPDLPDDPQLAHLGAFQTVPGATGTTVTLVSHPARYDGESPAVRLPPQPLGAQTRAIMAEAGYDAAEIDALAARGVVRTAA